MGRFELISSRVLRGAALLLLTGQAACGLIRSSSPETAQTVALVFANETPHQAEVWVGARDMQSRRVGVVMAGETTTLRVPQEFYARGLVNFTANLRGAGSPGVYDLRVNPEEELRIRLPREAKTLLVSR